VAAVDNFVVDKNGAFGVAHPARRWSHGFLVFKIQYLWERGDIR
jgi:hypothetical protein